jgi:DNA-binding transcriptional regulator YdaS (Cro superfamily)
MNSKKAARIDPEQLKDMMAAKSRAVKAAGGTKALGRKIGISGPAVAQWDIVPATRVQDVSRVSKVTTRELRTEIFTR